MLQQPATLELTATINDKTFPISSFTVNIPINVTPQRSQHLQSRRHIHHTHHTKATKHRRTHHTIHKRNQSIQNSIRNQPRRNRGGEILKTSEERKTSRVVALPLPDGRN